MMPALDILTISDFRSIKGTISIPLNAPIVLLHGLNGAGKTSVLSALELALTGDIVAMRRDDPDFARHLVHQGAQQASIRFSGAAITNVQAATTIADGKISPQPVLDAQLAQFFAERCYLAQSVLGRLLEIYSRADAQKDSALTRFVKDLLRLDELDALIDGLYDAGHLARAKNLVPPLRQADDLRRRFRQERDQAARSYDELTAQQDRQLTELRRLVANLTLDPPVVDAAFDELSALRQRLAKDAEEAALVRLIQRRRELNSLIAAWSELKEDTNAAERARLEYAARDAAVAAQAWRQDTGAKLDALIEGLRDLFPDLPSWMATDPKVACDQALERLDAEISRLGAALAREQKAETLVENARADLARAHSRLQIVDEQIKGTGESAGALARALAEVVPHIRGEDCPVCGQDFGQTGQGSLIVHVQQKIATLTEQAGRLSALATERTQTQTLVSEFTRQLASASASRLDNAARLDLQSRLARLSAPSRELKELRDAAARGAALIRAEARAQGRLAELRDRDRRQSDLRAALETFAVQMGLEVETTESFETGAARLLREVESEEEQLMAAREARISALTACDELIRVRDEARKIFERQQVAQNRFNVANDAFRGAEMLRGQARQIADTARDLRTAIVRRVFNEGLNTLWRDLFVRLAPTEQYVPAFRLPETEEGVVAQLETRTRTGEKGGTPGAMLSAGNLNTAALTLFLALHLSVDARFPWLVLDDPVQSMDEVHIAQFAALLRTVSKDHHRKVIIAVHERALYEYLRLELAPSFANDQLITVELRRSDTEETTAVTEFLPYGGEDVVAA